MNTLVLIEAFLIGILGGVHCLGMCGPIAFILPSLATHPSRQWIGILFYHFGRIGAYALMGALAATFGRLIFFHTYQQFTSILVGCFLLFGILVYIISHQRRSFKLVSWMNAKLKHAILFFFKKKYISSFMMIGFLNGFLPCGLVYVALVGAIALGHAWQGAIFMMCFGLATFPWLFSVSFFKKWITHQRMSRIRRFIPVFVIATSLLLILRGMNLGIPYISPKLSSNQSVSCHH